MKWHSCMGITVTSPSAYRCQGCGVDFCWTCETDLKTELGADDVYAIKTIANRFCEGCIELEAKAHGLPVDQIIMYRALDGRVVRRAN